MNFLSLVAALFVAAPVLSSPIAGPGALLSVESAVGATPGHYIVQFKKGASRKSHINKLGLKPKADWNNINGFAAELDVDALNALRASPDVESISEDGIVSASLTIIQTDAPWGLARISQEGPLAYQNPAATNYTYPYDATAGFGVDVYVLDTGVYTGHSDFTSGRATWGVSYVGETTDGNGHGTHCAGTIGGYRWGVSKRVNIISVQVLSSSGSGSFSGVISGLNWVQTAAAASGRPSVVSMSFVAAGSTSLDSAVATLTASGIHVVVAAGNNNANVSGYSPARVPSAITVGATTITDAVASFSNYGAFVDIFAPGMAIISTSIGSPTATISRSGTSMAAAHVAGIVAYLIGRDGDLGPGVMATKLHKLAVSGALTGVSSGTVNLLAQMV